MSKASCRVKTLDDGMFVLTPQIYNYQTWKCKLICCRFIKMKLYLFFCYLHVYGWCHACYFFECFYECGL